MYSAHLCYQIPLHPFVHMSSKETQCPSRFNQETKYLTIYALFILFQLSSLRIIYAASSTLPDQATLESTQPKLPLFFTPLAYTLQMTQIATFTLHISTHAQLCSEIIIIMDSTILEKPRMLYCFVE